MMFQVIFMHEHNILKRSWLLNSLKNFLRISQENLRIIAKHLQGLITDHLTLVL